MQTGTLKRMAILGGVFLLALMIPGAAEAKSKHWGFNYGPGGIGFHYGRGGHHGHYGYHGHHGHHWHHGYHYRPGRYYHYDYYPRHRYHYDYYPRYHGPYFGGCYFY